MKKNLAPLLLLAILCLIPTLAFAGPRDAAAALNRCGAPLKGDDTIFDNTVAGGHRTLKYERGTLFFDRVGNDGWTFTYGAHKRQTNLTPEEMEKYMPCLKDALADSAAPEPLKVITPVQRIEVSAKRGYKKLILWTIAVLALLGIAFYAWSKREKDEEEEE